MVKINNYRCNLCYKIFNTPEGVVGIYFLGKKIELTTAIQAENHLCNKCLGYLKDLIQSEKMECVSDER